MAHSIKVVGIDCIDIVRFKDFKNNPKAPFLKKVFSEFELIYCFGYKDPSSHLAGTFAAKEATSKALGVTKFPFAEIEIRHGKDGAPAAYRKGRKLPIKISITHTNTMACAIAVG